MTSDAQYVVAIRLETFERAHLKKEGEVYLSGAIIRFALYSANTA
jgi:hypothetical protein